jgi:hypothetical protein
VSSSSIIAATLTTAGAPALYPEAVVDTALAVAAGLLLAIAVLRRVRGVVAGTPARSAVPESDEARYERRVTTLLITLRVGLMVAAVVGVTILAINLLTG